MILHPPFCISARLMAAVKIGQDTLSIDYGSVDSNGRDVYDVWIDLANSQEFHITDLRSGCQGGTLQHGMASLCSFLVASAESRRYRESTGRDGENENLFQPDLVSWACENSDELTSLEIELEEKENLIEE